MHEASRRGCCAVVIMRQKKPFKSWKTISLNTGSRLGNITSGILDYETSIDHWRVVDVRLEEKMKYTRNDDELALYRDQIEYNKQLMTKRQEQMLSIVADQNSGQKKVSRKSANTIDKMLGEVALNVRREHHRLSFTKLAT